MPEPTQHSHPCGYCTLLKPCSCEYPALSEDFICDDCAGRWNQDTAEVHTIHLDRVDLDTLRGAHYMLSRDQTYRSLADRLQGIIDRVVVS